MPPVLCGIAARFLHSTARERKSQARRPPIPRGKPAAAAHSLCMEKAAGRQGSAKMGLPDGKKARILMAIHAETGGEKMTEVVAALIWEKNKFLICQRPAHKARGLLWEFVGGKVEPGETKEQALRRECREELDIAIDVGDVFMEVTHTYPDLTVHLTLFHASIREGVPRKLEHNDIRWITADEIDAYDFCPADEVILNRLKSGC